MPPRQGLSRDAYEELPEGKEYQPYVPAGRSIAEFTAKAVIPGVLFGILFGAANAYLGLQAGLTISTSIPVAVMSVAFFRALRGIGRQGTLLEANTAQTVGSASSSVASGVIFTLPALFLWGMPPDLLQMTLLALCGGLLGVLFMVPLRSFLIAREHGKLPYPEGTACAEVLVASEVGGGQARNVFAGLAVGAVFKALFEWARVLPLHVKFPVPPLPKAQLGLKMSAALFGVGYILGPRIGAVMVGGGLLSWLVIIPILATWGRGRAEPLYPATVPLDAMPPGDIWESYVRYIGAGAVATAGFITLIRSLPVMVSSFRIGARQLRQRMDAGTKAAAEPRTSRDLPLKFVGLGVLVLVAVMALVPSVFGPLAHAAARPLAAVLVAIFAFFFVTVASRIVGLVGVTSNPTSGMTIASLIGTSAVFLLLGWTGDADKAAALCVGCVVAIAASIAGDTSQDLKTGFLLGATPRRQQIGELIGVLTCAAFVCWTVQWMSPDFGTEKLPAPQATLMKVVIDGVLQQSLPWGLIGIGAGIAILIELLRLPSLPFAVGVYLPVTTMVPVFLGGMLRWFMERKAPTPEASAERRERGVLFGSGLVGGEGLMGIAVAGAAFYYGESPVGIGQAWAERVGAAVGISATTVASIAALLVFAALATFFARLCAKGKSSPAR